MNLILAIGLSLLVFLDIAFHVAVSIAVSALWLGVISELSLGVGGVIHDKKNISNSQIKRLVRLVPLFLGDMLHTTLAQIHRYAFWKILVLPVGLSKA